ncbi:hypothetical protein LTS08_007876 [Lithohypha guttulata]|nr:hypothetical protein LTS08_007876 [Lithohypha guttulata]
MECADKGSLKQIHQILLTAERTSVKAAPRKSQSIKSSSNSSTSSSSDVRNGFFHLGLTEKPSFHVVDDSDDEVLSDNDTDDTSECSHSPVVNRACACEVEDNDTDFLDTEGKVGSAFEAVMFLDSIERIAAAARLCWTKAGHGEMLVPAAAAYTNMLVVRAVNHVRNFHENEPDLSSPAAIGARIANACIEHDQIAVSENGAIGVLEGLGHAEQVLTDLRLLPDSDPTKTTKRPDGSPPLSEYRRVLHGLASGLCDEAEQEHCSSIIHSGLVHFNPVVASTVVNLAGAEVLESYVDLYLLAASHAAYSSALSQPRFIATPRICALKLAQEAITSIDGFLDDKTIIPCQCVKTIGHRLAQTRSDLQAFAKYKCWSTLMQSPLVAGNHVLEILDSCSHYGMYLFHFRQYTAGVLHCYQALTQLQRLEKVPILEELCDSFVDVLYTTGTRADSGFMMCWLRYIGARLKFRKGKKYQDHKETWCMAVPSHTAKKTAGLNIGGKDDEAKAQPKFDYGTIDRVTRFKHEGWVLHEKATEKLDKELVNDCCTTKESPAGTSSPDQPSSPPDKSRRSKHKRNKSCQISKNESETSTTCHKLDHLINASFVVDRSQERDLPPSRINLLSLFHSMAKVVAGISDETHVEDDRDITSSGSDGGRGKMCICFVQAILQAADRIQDVRKKKGIHAAGATLTKNEKECVECYKKHLMNMLEQAKVLDGSGGLWLWSSI